MQFYRGGGSRVLKDSKNISREGYLHENYHYFHLRDTAGQERSFHFHDFDKIVLLLSGKVDYTVENTVYPLQPWSLLLVRHHAIHRALIDVSAPYERIILYLDPGFFAPLPVCRPHGLLPHGRPHRPLPPAAG